jgi:hypothetical protein
MNYNIDEDKWFEMEYYRMPGDMSADDDSPELPETFHWAIILWAIWTGHRVRREPANAFSTKKDFEDFMKGRVTDMEIGGDRSSNLMSFSFGRSE